MNIIIQNEFVGEWDRNNLFPDDEDVVLIRFDNPRIKDMFDILVLAEVFSSRGQAKKNWKKTTAEIPKGWSEFWVGKKKKQICIWNPWC